VARADFNGDGKQDLAVVTLSARSVSIRLGDGAGGFAVEPNLLTGSRPHRRGGGGLQRRRPAPPWPDTAPASGLRRFLAPELVFGASRRFQSQSDSILVAVLPTEVSSRRSVRRGVTSTCARKPKSSAR
jgi:hypothetical protein